MSKSTGGYIASRTAPSSPDPDDRWYDMTHDLWKRWNGTSWTVSGTAAPLGYAAVPTSGQYCAAPHSAIASASPAQNIQYFQFLPLSAPCTLSSVGVETTAGSASTTIRLGIYADNNGAPGTLLEDTGALATTTTGAIEQALSALAVTPPGIWVSSCRQSATGASFRVSSGPAQPIYTRNALTTVTGFVLSCFSLSAVTGAFASNPTGYIGDVNPPIVCIKFT